MKTSALRRNPHATPPPLRRTALAALIAASFGAAQANPTLPQVVNGQATFTQDGKLFSVTNTPNTIINWQSFSIGAGEITRFVQQSASSAVLNRITGQDPSAILGSLQSNGKVFLINPNGILFGANARVDVNGLVASSLNITNQDFLAGTMNFNGDQAGKVTNQGTIHAANGGQVLLIAPDVENTGLISAPNGDVLLAAGHSVQLADAANPALRFVVASGGQALNVGQVIAQGGTIGMAGAVVRQRGVLNADSAQVGPGGTIVLRASSQALLETGSVTTARSASGTGGAITVLGDQVGLLGNAHVDASGDTGGGTILLGGDYQGSNPAIPNARQVAVESGVTIAADAIDSGNGGKVIVWGDQTARVFGSISARGGVAYGNGGLVETSGHYLDVKGVRVNTSATSTTRGKPGTWLLDPYDIDVVAGGGGSLAAVDNFDDAPADGVTQIGADLISSATADVLLQATHNIAFNSAVNIVATNVSLNATAGASITVNAPITTNGGGITLSANDASSGHAYGGGSNVQVNAPLTSNGGPIILSGDSVLTPGAITTGSGGLTVAAIGAVTSSDDEANDGRVVLGGAVTVGGDMHVSSAAMSTATGIVSVGGMFRLDGGAWVQNSATLPGFSAHDFAINNGTFLRAAGGDGASAPYRIVDAYGLQGMSRQNEPLNYTLASNIDASGTVNWNEGSGFKSIYGGDGYAWQGSLDGDGFAISGLVINDSGLFRSLDGATVSNLTLAGGSVHGSVYVGAVTGLNAGTISNVHSSMDVNGNQTSGGLVGYNAGLITGSSSSGNVSLTGNTAGGLVGYNDGSGRIALSSASGNVTALGDSAGGLVGTNSHSDNPSGTITQSFATGNVSGASDVGGLVGTNSGIISQAYATGTVQIATGASDLTHQNMGGLIGYNNAGGSATQIYSTGQVLGAGFDASTVGGLVGAASASALEGGYWDIGTSGQAGDHGGGAGLTHAQMLQPASFIGFDFTSDWRIYAGYTTPLVKALLTPVTVTATAATTKVYDGQLATFGGTLGYTGLLGSDTGVDGSAGYGTALNVGTYALDGLYSTKYDITLAGNAQLAITPRALTATISGSKIYDSQTSLNGAVFSLTNVVNGDAISATGTALFADKNAGTGKPVSASDVALTGNTFGNYTLASIASGTADIARATLTLDGVAASSKVYDGTTYATLMTNLGNVKGSDQVAVTNPTAAFADKNAGTGKTVNYSIANASLTGADAANYQITASGSVLADIAQRSLYIDYTAPDKVYDGNTLANVTLSDTRIAGDVLTVAASANYDGKNAGFHGINLSGISVTGADAANYSAVAPDFIRTANITPRALTVAVSGSKVYDSLTSLNGATFTLGNVVDGDAVTASGTTTFADKNAGTGKALSASGISLAGDASANYTVAGTASGTGAITQRALYLGYTPADKVYDGTTAASVTLSDSRIAGDVLTVAASASFGDKNVGSNPVYLSGVSVTGLDAGNYSVIAPDFIAFASITPRALTALVSGTKVYDGGVGLANATFSLGNVVDGDAVTASGAAYFADKNAGTGKALSAMDISLAGDASANYTIASTASGTGAITRATLAVGSISAANKVYDGSTGATVAAVLGGVIGTDQVILAPTGSFADKNVGTAKTVNYSAGNANLTGVDAANYQLDASGATTASITPAKLALTNVVANNKVYDATTSAVVSATLGGVVGADQVGIAATSGSFSDKNVGAAKTVNYSITLDGADAGNYLVASSGSTTAAITARALNLGYTANGKVYDATSAATVVLTDDRIAGDFLTVGASASFADKNVGTKAVSLANVALQGADAGNYSVVLPSSTVQATITPLMLAAQVTANNKVYDATTGATVTATLGGVLGTDQVGVAGTSGSFADKNVGAAKSVSYTVALNGVDAGNYQLAANGTTTADITARALTIGYTANGKVYDTTTTAAVALTDDRIAGDVLTVAANANFADKNAGIKAVSLSNVALQGADAGNYSLVLPASTVQATITPAMLAASVTANNKVYDGTTTAALSATLGGVLGADQVGVASASGNFSDKNVGVAKTVHYSITLIGADAGNYQLAANNASTTADITARALNLAYTASGKVYDATTAATVTLSDDRIAGDALTVAANASFADKNVGIKAVSLSNVALQGADAGNYSVILPTSTVQATITPAMLAAAVTANNKVYDATTGATLSSTLSGVLGADQVGVGGTSASFADKNVGAAKSVNYTVALNGVDAGNYHLAANGTTTADITARTLNIGYTANGKVYDATTAATVALSDDRIAGDALIVAANASFAHKNVGTKAVSLSNVALQGADAGNYSVVLPASAVQGTITPAMLAAAITANNKVYDATTGATLSSTLSGVLGADQVGVAGTSASFADKNVGTAKAVNYTVALNGVDAGNYQLASAGTTTADITARALNIGYTANGKVYDATTAATVALTDDRIAGDALTVAANASFADKNVGTKAVSLSNVALQGADAGNYSVALPGSTVQATITPAMLAAAVTANNKVYDATTGATLSSTLSGVLGTDQVGVAGASGSFADKNVGAAKSVNYTVALNGVDAGNYQLAMNGTTTANITARALNIGYTANGKVYDATTAATVALTDDRIAGDTLTVAANASFADKNVGTKAVSLSKVALQGADAGNYTVVLPATATQATITPAALALASVTASDKVYDGTRAATVGATVTGVLGQDAVSAAGGTGTFADSNHGAGKTVTAIGFGLAGADAGNYVLTATGGVAQASIAQKALSTWIGASNGLWSDAANWDGGVVPLADNVLAATIAGANGVVNYTAAAGTTVLQTLTSGGGLAISGGSLTLGAGATDRSTLSSLNLSGGALTVNGALATTSYAQSASTLGGAGSLTVGSSFSQTGGAIALAGDVALTQAAGDLRVASLSGGAVSLNATGGAIGQSGAISATSLVTRAQSGIVLNNSGNRVASFTAANSGSGGIALTNATAPGQLVLGSLVTGSGNIAIDNTGGIESHAIAANGGNVSLVAHSPVNVQGAISGNDVSLQASTDIALADGASINAAHDVAITAGAGLTLDGSAALKAGNKLALTAGDDLLLKGAATLEVPATGSMALLAQRGSIVAGTGVRIDSHGAPVSLSAPNGLVTAPAGVFVGATLAAVSTGGVPLATPAPQSTIVNYASTVSQQYSPLNLLSPSPDASTPLVPATPAAATSLEEKLTGTTDAKKMYCN